MPLLIFAVLIVDLLLLLLCLSGLFSMEVRLRRIVEEIARVRGVTDVVSKVIERATTQAQHPTIKERGH